MFHLCRRNKHWQREALYYPHITPLCWQRRCKIIFYFFFPKNSEGSLWKPKILPCRVTVELKLWIPLCKLQKQKRITKQTIWWRRNLCVFSCTNFLSGCGYNRSASSCFTVESGGVTLLHLLRLPSILARGEEFSICSGFSNWRTQPQEYYPCRKKTGFVVCNVPEAFEAPL